MRVAFNRSWLLLGLALVIGGISAYGVKRYIEQHVEDIEARSRSHRMVKVVVPKQDLAKGAQLKSELLAVREVPAEWAHTNAITPEQFDRVEGQLLAYPVAAGEMLLWSLLEGQRAASFSARLPSGQRAITVPVDEVNSISGLLQPGDRIDLMVSAKRDNKSYLFPLLQNVTVLATGAQAIPMPGWDGKEGSKRHFTNVTLEASPEDARRVLAAREVGKLSAMLRAPGDKAPIASTRAEAYALLGMAGRETAPAHEGVPVLYGGRGEIKSLPPLGGRPQPDTAEATAAATAAAAALAGARP